jgi:RHS repeat-associated protein
MVCANTFPQRPHQDKHLRALRGLRGLKKTNEFHHEVHEGSEEPTLPREFRYLFTCQEWDATAGLYYYDARWYDSATGRFITQDPLGFAAGDENLYRYCHNSPTNATDPSGLKSPKSVQYISGLGLFSQATLGPYDSEMDWITRLGSSFHAFWEWNTKDFKDKCGCCTCKKIGFIQIVAQDSSYFPGARGIIPPNNWRIDIGIPYPYATTRNPCDGTGRKAINLRDMPNAPKYYFGALGGPILKYLWQRFETCVVCLDSNTTSMTVYGCITWEHHIFNDAQQHYGYTRAIGSTQKTGGANKIAEVTNVAGGPPSSNWIKVVLG